MTNQAHKRLLRTVLCSLVNSTRLSQTCRRKKYTYTAAAMRKPKPSSTLTLSCTHSEIMDFSTSCSASTPFLKLQHQQHPFTFSAPFRTLHVLSRKSNLRHKMRQKFSTSLAILKSHPTHNAINYKSCSTFLTRQIPRKNLSVEIFEWKRQKCLQIWSLL